MNPKKTAADVAVVEVTKVTKNQPNSESLRTKIPPGVKSTLGLASGDEIEWDVVFRDGKKVAEVRKKQA